MLKKYLYIFIVSMVPLIELRGAVPMAIAFGLPIVPAYLICIVGNMIPVPIIFFFARKVLIWGSQYQITKSFCEFFLLKGEKAGKKLTEKVGRNVYLALFLFVGIPVPGTGAWTGTLASSILDLDFKKSVIAILGGIILAGIIMGLASSGLFSMMGF